MTISNSVIHSKTIASARCLQFFFAASIHFFIVFLYNGETMRVMK